MSVIVENLTKIYGSQRAVDDVSFSAFPNEILGFLGPNGAGKSTTMKIITCFIPPTHGNVLVNGEDVSESGLKVKSLIGYLPENNPLYLDMYVHEYLRFIGGLNRIKGNALRKRADAMVELCGLEREQNKVIGTLSKGYRQRVGLAQALISDPSVLILDEPTSGLDPNQIVDVRSLIKEISREKTVILSTHIMQEVEAICDRAVIINKGKIVMDGKVDEIKQAGGTSQRVRIKMDDPISESLFEGMDEIEKIERIDEKSLLVISRGTKDIRPSINKLIAEKELILLEMSSETSSLEDIFRTLTTDQLEA